MDVLIKGVSPEQKVYKGMCLYCKSTMRYSGSEIISTSYEQRNGPIHYLGNCPVCNKNFYNYHPIEV